MYTGIIKQSGNWWIGWIEEVQGVNCQEATREELLESLRITLLEVLEMVDSPNGRNNLAKNLLTDIAER